MIFIDFEASSLSPRSYPIEVGIARIVGDEVCTESRLIRPHPTWDIDDWHPDSAAIHGIPRAALEDAPEPETIAEWLMEEVGAAPIVSDAPDFDGLWLGRLLMVLPGQSVPVIEDYAHLIHAHFSDGGSVNPGALEAVFDALSAREPGHRAGDDADRLACAYRAGVTLPVTAKADILSE